MPRPTTLFWAIVLIGVVPFYVRLPERRWRPDEVFAAWDRAIIRIRAAEWAAILVYLATVYIWPWNFPLTPWSRAAAVAGLILTAGGAFLSTWSKVRLGVWFSTTLGVKRDHQLIDTGPYALVRHPIYTSLDLVLLGGTLVYNRGPALLLLFLPFCAFFYWQSVVEQRLLLNPFGDAYRRYRDRTGRLLPQILR